MDENFLPWIKMHSKENTAVDFGRILKSLFRIDGPLFSEVFASVNSLRTWVELLLSTFVVNSFKSDQVELDEDNSDPVTAEYKRNLRALRNKRKDAKKNKIIRTVMLKADTTKAKLVHAVKWYAVFVGLDVSGPKMQQLFRSASSRARHDEQSQIAGVVIDPVPIVRRRNELHACLQKRADDVIQRRVLRFLTYSNLAETLESRINFGARELVPWLLLYLKYFIHPLTTSQVTYMVISREKDLLPRLSTLKSDEIETLFNPAVEKPKLKVKRKSAKSARNLRQRFSDRSQACLLYAGKDIYLLQLLRRNDEKAVSVDKLQSRAVKEESEDLAVKPTALKLPTPFAYYLHFYLQYCRHDASHYAFTGVEGGALYRPIAILRAYTRRLGLDPSRYWLAKTQSTHTVDSTKLMHLATQSMRAILKRCTGDPNQESLITSTGNRAATVHMGFARENKHYYGLTHLRSAEQGERVLDQMLTDKRIFRSGVVINVKSVLPELQCFAPRLIKHFQMQLSGDLPVSTKRTSTLYAGNVPRHLRKFNMFQLNSTRYVSWEIHNNNKKIGRYYPDFRPENRHLLEEVYRANFNAQNTGARKVKDVKFFRSWSDPHFKEWKKTLKPRKTVRR